MKVLRKIALFVDWTLAVALGLGVLVFVFQSVMGNDPLLDLQPKYVALRGWYISIATLAGCGLLLLNLAVVLDIIAPKLWSEYLKLETEHGTVRVAIKAVQDALTRSITALEEVSGARVLVAAPGKPGRPVVIRAYVALRESVVYHSISRGIIDVLESKFSDIVSEGTPVECHVYWEKIKHDASRQSSLRQEMPVDDLRPRFPVDQ